MGTKSEQEFGTLMRSYGHTPIKLPDRVVCNVCHSLIQKQHNFWIDFVVPTAGHFVEVKEADVYFPFANLNDDQRFRLSTWEDHAKGRYSWVFLELGKGRAPKGRSAYLIPFKEFQRLEEELLAQGQKSIQKETKRNPGGDEVFGVWKLHWIKEVGWIFPQNPIHPFRLSKEV